MEPWQYNNLMNELGKIQWQINQLKNELNETKRRNRNTRQEDNNDKVLWDSEKGLFPSND